MKKQSKTKQLQIRVRPFEKSIIQEAAKRDGKSVSQWVLEKVLPRPEIKFNKLLSSLSISKDDRTSRFILAEINDFLTPLTPKDFKIAVHVGPQDKLNPLYANFVAAMVEMAAHKKNVLSPPWTFQVRPLQNPVFSTNLITLRPYLLTHSPPPFRRRNLFVDSSIGDRV